MINVAAAGIKAETGRVTVFAPVIPETPYRFAGPIGDYPTLFTTRAGERTGATAFSSGDIVGPMRFGEIAYVLLTGTPVHPTIETA